MPDSRQLTDFVEPATLQSLQDGFFALTGIPTNIRDANGAPITRSSGQSQFCDLMRSTPAGETACRTSHMESASQVAEQHAPFQTTCHADLVQFSAPITVDGTLVGSITLGDRPRKKFQRHQVQELARLHGIEAGLLCDSAEHLSVWSDEEMHTATQFIQHLANTIAQLCFHAFELRNRAEELRALNEMSSMLAGKATLQEIMDMATNQLVKTLSLKASSLRLLDEDSGDLKIASVANLSQKYLDKGPVMLDASAIDRRALAGETVYVADMRTDPRTIYKRGARDEGLVSALITPVTSGGKAIGVLRAYSGEIRMFSQFEISLLQTMASQVGAAITKARFQRDARGKEQLARQLKLAGEVQRRMIPQKTPEHPHYQFGCMYQPSTDLSGDFYDFIRFDNTDIGVVVADVVGKGVPASLMMASVRSALRSHARRVTEMSEIMLAVNRRLHFDTLPGEFATAFYMELSADGTKVKYCNAGHEPMLLLRDGNVTSLDSGGLAWGIDPDEKYECNEAGLEPGDLLLLFTDGLSEARNFDGKAYGRERLHQSFKTHGGASPPLTADFIAKQLLWDVRRFTGLAPLGDDLTLVVIRVR
jgi:sigma-B regulation protein RsbU (phosphoserine phosphatase)